jgi:hypothetical protein
VIDHVIMFKPRPDLTPEDEQKLWARLRELADLPGVVDYALGRNFGDRSRGFDVCMRVTFETRADLDAYEANPGHLDVVAFNRQLTAEHLCVDFEWEPVDRPD